MEAQVQFHASLYRIFGGQSGAGTGFSLMYFDLPTVIVFPPVPHVYSFICH
jgi:hypothetical protein